MKNDAAYLSCCQIIRCDHQISPVRTGAVSYSFSRITAILRALISRLAFKATSPYSRVATFSSKTRILGLNGKNELFAVVDLSVAKTPLARKPAQIYRTSVR